MNLRAPRHPVALAHARAFGKAPRPAPGRLRYLVALAAGRTFGKAAERCYVSQPTLSAQIRKLEEYLGVSLVERQPKRVALTAPGVKIVERARRLLQEADAIVELAKTDRDPLAGPLKLALIPTVGPYLLPHVTARLRREVPRVKLMLYEYQTQPLLEKLRAGEIDAGIVALPIDPDGLESLALYDEPFMLAVPAHHLLADKDKVRIEDLKGETLLLLEDGHCLRDQALEVCGRIRVNEAQEYRPTSLETLAPMVAARPGLRKPALRLNRAPRASRRRPVRGRQPGRGREGAHHFRNRHAPLHPPRPLPGGPPRGGHLPPEPVFHVRLHPRRDGQ